MLQEVKNKLEELYNEVIKPQKDVLDVFIDYFGEERIDYTLYTFEKFVDSLADKTFREVCNYYNCNIITDSDQIVHFKKENSEITMSAEQAKKRAGKPFLSTLTVEEFDFFSNFFSRYLLLNSAASLVILIIFPRVRVTNEHDKFIDIQDLFARVSVTVVGTLSDYITLHRATYSAIQYLSNYAHSHLPGIPRDWERPCYGDGPIIRTMNKLMGDNNLEYWGLLCYELSKYVTVESLEGVPYRRLEDIGTNRGNMIRETAYFSEHLPSYSYYGLLNPTIKEFILSFLKEGNLKFSYYNGSYQIGEHTTSLWIKASKAFANWYNQMFSEGRLILPLTRLQESGIIAEGIVSGNTVYSTRGIEDLENALREDGRELFMFKGKMVKLTITGLEDMSDITKTYLISKSLLNYIMTAILTIVNYKYGRTGEKEGGEGKSQETPVDKKCYFI